MAAGVPSLGYKLYRLIPAEAGWSGPEGVRAAASELENDFLKVRLDPKTGWIESLYDKTAQREVLAGPGNVLEAITDEPKEMSAWELGLKGLAGRAGENGAIVELVEKGPVRAVIRVKSRFRDSTFEQDLTLYAGLPRLDCRTRLDWRERNIMIKAAFPLAVKAPAARFEIPYGSIARPADGTEVPALRWIDVSEGSGAIRRGAPQRFEVRLRRQGRRHAHVRRPRPDLPRPRGRPRPPGASLLDPPARRGLERPPR